MSFLETLTALGNNVLVPIKEIQKIWITYGDYGWEIHIESEDGHWIECFEKDNDKLNKRYEMIKHILGVKSEEEILTEMKKGKK